MISLNLTIIFVIIAVLVGFLLGWIIAVRYANVHKHIWNNKDYLSQMFENLSAKTLQNNSIAYIQHTNQHLQHILNPFYQNLQKLEQQMHNLEKNRIGAYSSLTGTVHQLNNEIQNLYASNQDLKMITQNLNQALRSDHQSRGKWGEIQLRRIVEIVGMKSHIDFNTQASLTQGNNIIRPDMIIHMPHEGIIPVDAKAPMTAYLDACNASTKEERDHHLAKHKQSLEGHIKTLSGKEYWNQSNFSAPQLVVMFIPYESGLEASLSFDPMLLDKALSSKVIVAGPSSLYALLKVISYGWMQVSLMQNTTEIHKLSKDLFQRFSIFYEHFSKIGGALNTTVTTFNKASSSLQQRLMPTLNAINTLGESDIHLPKSEEMPIIDSTAQVHDSSNMYYKKHAQESIPKS